ncbi:MAG TPA: GTP-binding protein, partial [Rhodothermales bacterium]|nr:GTP-binding protein [Rhodothermales bacterium]
MSKRAASCCVVSMPLRASRATFALNWGECCLRFAIAVKVMARCRRAKSLSYTAVLISGSTTNNLAIPPEIIAEVRNPSTIFDYLRQKQTGTRRLNEAKVLVVGQGSVGKTSLIRRLLYDDFDPAENKTEGIDIQEWQVKVEDQSIDLHMWDFGGQEIMHATHQFFLTKRSLHVLVLDARLGEEENCLEYWLKMVESFGGDSPVIIVGNKVDQQRLDLDQKGLRTKYPAIQDFVETSCDTNEGIDDLRTVITHEVGALDHIYDELPLTWYTIKSRLEEMDEDYLPYHRYEEICAEVGVIDTQRQRNLVGFLHDLGVVLNFK